MITPGQKVSINIQGLPPGVRDSVKSDQGTVKSITWNQVFIVEVAGRKDPLLCDACDIAVLPEQSHA